MNYKSQSAIEFMVLAGAIIFFFALFFIGIHAKMFENLKEQRRSQFEKTAEDIKREIDFAFESTDGYQRNFFIPDEINNKDYKVNITEGIVYLRTLDSEFGIAIPTHNVTGFLNKGENTIKKEGGIIYINPP